MKWRAKVLLGIMAFVIIGIAFIMLPSVTAAASYWYAPSVANVTGNNVTIVPNNMTHLNISGISPYANLVGYWSFDSDAVNTLGFTAYDFSNQSNDGTGVNQTNVTSTNCVYGKCVQFDGTVSYIDNKNIGLGNKNYTIMAWVNLKDNTSNSGILGYPTVGRLIFRINATGLWLFHRTPNIGIYGSYNFNNDVWYHVAAIFSNTTGMALYANGNVINSDSSKTSYGNAAGVTQIGHTSVSSSGGDLYFNGTMDEIMVFDTALTAAQVLAIYNNQSARFVEQGNATYAPFNITGGDNQLNASMINYTRLFATNISLRIQQWDGSSWSYTDWQNITDLNTTDSLNVFTISTSTTNILPEVRLLANGSQFYTPITGNQFSFATFTSGAPPDTTPPFIWIFSPNATYATTNKTTVDLQYIASDAGLDKIMHNYTAAGDNATVTANSSLAKIEGLKSIIMYANDTTGNYNKSQIVNINVDTQPPNTTIDNTSGSTFSAGIPIAIQGTCTDDGTADLHYAYTNNSNFAGVDSSAEIFNLTNTSSLAAASYSVYVFCNDTYGNNLNFSMITFTVQAADTCTFPASGDCNVQCSDNCVFSATQTCHGNLLFGGTGTIWITADIYVDGYIAKQNGVCILYKLNEAKIIKKNA